MTETIAPISPNEQYTHPVEPLAALQVFNGIYGSFAETARNAPLQRNAFIDGQVVRVAVNPVLEFVEKRFTGAHNSIEPYEDVKVGPRAIQREFMDEVAHEAKEVYAGQPAGVAMRLERAKRLTSGLLSRAEEMYKSGEADGLTIKVFFGSLEKIKYGLSTGYNDLMDKRDEPVTDEESRNRYANSVYGILDGRDDVKEQSDGLHLHVNGDRHLETGNAVTERYYISPKLNEQPGEVFKIWAETLESLGLDKKLYYKVAEGLLHRYDTVIAYATPETANYAELAIQEFSRRCPPDLLSDTPMPSGIEVAKGVAKAAEPTAINTLLRYRGKVPLSYNEYVCGLTELALRRAGYDLVKQGIPLEQVKPIALKEAAKPYFVNFIKLSGLDPATMKAA